MRSGIPAPVGAAAAGRARTRTLILLVHPPDRKRSWQELPREGWSSPALAALSALFASGDRGCAWPPLIPSEPGRLKSFATSIKSQVGPRELGRHVLLCQSIASNGGRTIIPQVLPRGRDCASGPPAAGSGRPPQVPRCQAGRRVAACPGPGAARPPAMPPPRVLH